MSNPNRPQSVHPQGSRPAADTPGRTALVSMFPLHMDPPAAPTRPEHRTPQRPDSLNGGK